LSFAHLFILYKSYSDIKTLLLLAISITSLSRKLFKYVWVIWIFS